MAHNHEIAGSNPALAIVARFGAWIEAKAYLEKRRRSAMLARPGQKCPGQFEKEK